MKIKYFLALSIFLSLSSISFAQDKLPSIQLSGLDGKKTDILTEVKKNQLTVISFWATWCAPCIKELENIMAHYPDWQEDYNMELIAVSIDEPRTRARVKPFVSGKGFPYHFLIDENKELFKALNGVNPPLTLIINQDGEILDVKPGYVDGDEYILEEKLKKFSKK